MKKKSEKKKGKKFEQSQAQRHTISTDTLPHVIPLISSMYSRNAANGMEPTLAAAVRYSSTFILPSPPSPCYGFTSSQFHMRKEGLFFSTPQNAVLISAELSQTPLKKPFSMPLAPHINGRRD
jgi:hypothetical protein